MTCYIVSTNEETPRYVSRGKLVVYRENAGLYSSPFAATVAANTALKSNPLVESMTITAYAPDKHPNAIPIVIRR